MTSEQQILRNASRRPVEVHLGDRVEVLLPDTMMTCDVGDLNAAGVAPLLTSGILTHFDAPPPMPMRARRKPAKRVIPKAKRKGAATKGAVDTSSRSSGKRQATEIALPDSLPAKSPTAKSGRHTTSSGDPT